MGPLSKSKTVASIITLASVPSTCLGQGCGTIDECNAACIGWEVANSFCQKDFQPWDTEVSCLCEYPYHSINSGSKAILLDQCVICNVEGVGPNSLAFYQYWTFVCDVYSQDGEQAAQNAADNSDEVVVSAFSSTLLPLLSSSLCGGSDVTSTTSTTSSFPVTTSTTSATDTTSVTDTTSIAGTTSASGTPTPVPTHNSAARADLAFMRNAALGNAACLIMAALSFSIGLVVVIA